MKNTETISISMPKKLVEKLDKIQDETNLSRSAVMTAVLSVVLNWDILKEALENDLR